MNSTEHLRRKEEEEEEEEEKKNVNNMKIHV
jgi:hypothetical protein